MNQSRSGTFHVKDTAPKIAPKKHKGDNIHIHTHRPTLVRGKTRRHASTHAHTHKRYKKTTKKAIKNVFTYIIPALALLSRVWWNGARGKYKRERRWERAHVQVSTGFIQQTWRITTHLREGDNWTELSALFIAGAKVQMSHSQQGDTQGRV